MRRCLGLACGLLASCAEHGRLELLAPDIPEQGRVAVLLLDSAGAPIEGSGLLSADPSISFEVDHARYEEIASAFVAFFDDETLAKLPLPEERELRETRVEEPKRIDPRFPRASWSGAGRFEDGKASVLPTSEDRALTVSWLPACEATFGSSSVVQVGCAFRPCEPAVQQVGCQLEIEASSASRCNRGELVGFVDALGGMSFEPSASFGRCQSRDDLEWARAAASCEGGELGLQCNIEIFDRGQEARIELDSKAFTLPASGLPLGGAKIGGLVVLNDRVVVSASGRATSSWLCEDDGTGLFLMVDPESLDLVDSATAPPCLRNLVPEPGFDTFLATFRAPGPKIARFDSRGRLLASSELDVPLQSGRPFFVRQALLVLAQGQVVLLVGEEIGEPPEQPYRWVSVALDTLAVRKVSSPLLGRLREATVVEGRIAVIDDDSNTLQFFGASDLELIELHALVSETKPRLLRSVGYHALSGRFMVASRAEADAGIIFSNGAKVVGYGVDFEELYTRPMVLETWAADPALAVVSLERDAVLGQEAGRWFALADPSNGSFLPGRLRAEPHWIPGAYSSRPGSDAMWFSGSEAQTLIRLTPKP